MSGFNSTPVTVTMPVSDWHMLIGILVEQEDRYVEKEDSDRLLDIRDAILAGFQDD